MAHNRHTAIRHRLYETIALYYEGIKFYGIVLGYLVAAMATFSLSIIYGRRKGLITPSRHVSKSEIKFLLLFGLPIMTVGFSSYFMIYSDTVVLGFFKNVIQVGYYSAALSLSKLSFLGINALGFIILPVASGLLSSNRRSELNLLYGSVIKWNLVISVPIFLLFFMFPSASLSIAFGSRYGRAAVALQILALGSFINTIVGPSSPALVATGKTRRVALSGLLGASFNLVLSISLIPFLGFIGAAIASVLGSFVYRLLCLTFFVRENDLQPFTLNFVKPLLLSVSLPFAIFIIYRPFIDALSILIILASTFIFSIIAILVTGSLEESDVFILEFVEQLFRKRLNFVRSIGRRFIVRKGL